MTQSSDPNPFLIVGIGTSAGGVEALQTFFQHVPADSGMAYVVILHLSPDHDSQLAQILQTVASIPVTQVTAQVRVAPNHVYVVPPNQHLLMVDGALAVLPTTQIEERRAPVDIFFRTLAESHGPQAVAVVLSGTGANGSMGLKRVKEHGGAVFVQNPREAAWSEMPRHAIATDLVDDVLPVAEIPAKIVAYSHHLGTVAIPVDADARPADQQQALREVFNHLRVRTGHDFSNYKRPTLLRRIERRINVRNLPDLPAYAAVLREHPAETQALLKDLLISVTNFFRDPAAFAAIEREILPQILRGKRGDDVVRIWVIGCATGEEAYSLAMLCAERTFDVLDAPRVQIFATDIDDDALATARDGLYSLNDAADVSPERLRRFFTHEGDRYRVSRELRELVLFANHNVLKDPPFGRLDLVTCRNMLIYLNQTGQARVMDTVHFALLPGGYLFLGSSESVDGASDLFASVSREHHIFQSRMVGTRPLLVPESIALLRMEPARRSDGPLDTRGPSPERISYGDLHAQLLEHYAPPSIVVNEAYDIVHVSDQAGRFLQVAGGELSSNLLTLIRPELRRELRTALYQAVQRRTNVDVNNLHVRIGDRAETITLRVRPVLREGDAARGFVLILFAPSTDARSDTETVVTSGEPVVRQLEDEVLHLKTQLRTSSEQHDVQDEELRGANEELQALNEELRSAAEELETSKEELQSINEELRTINQELKIKVEEITLARNNLQNLINSTAIGTIFLDRAFRVALFTPAAREIFNLIPADYNRPLSDITHRLAQVDVVADAERVLATLQPLEREVHTTDGRDFSMRLLPYRTADDRIGGVVVTFMDITERKRADEALRASEAKYRTLFDSIDEGFCLLEMVYDESGTPVDWLYLEGNPAFVQQSDGFSALSKRGSEFLSRADDSWLHLFDSVIKTGESKRIENRTEALDRWYTAHVSRIDGGSSHQVAVVFDDITESKHHEQRQAFLLKFSDALRSLTDSIAIQETSARVLGEYLGVNRAYYSRLDWERGVAVIERDFFRGAAPSVVGAHSLASFAGSEQAYRDGVLVLDDVEDAHLLPPSDVLAYRALSVRSVLSVVLVKEGVWVASMTLLNTVPHHWTTQEISLLEATAEHTWAFVERARAEEALHKSEEEKALLLRLSDTLRTIHDPMEVEQVAMQLLGEQLGLSRAYSFHIECDDDGGWVHIIDNAYQRDPDGPSMIGRHALKPFGSQMFEDLARGEVVAASDVSALPALAAEELASYGALGVTAFVNVPLLHDGEYRAGIGAHDTAPHAWTPAEIALMREVAMRMWTFVERARAEAALRESEERLQSITNLIPDLLWDSEPDGSTTWYNYRWFEYTGQTFDQAIGWGWADAIHPDDRETSTRQYQEAVESGALLRQEHRIRRHDGAYRWFVVNTFPLKNDGKVVKVYGAATDIHESRIAFDAIQQSEARLQQAISIETVGVVFLDEQGQFTDTNDAFSRLSGYTHEEIASGDLGWRDLTPPEWVKRSEQAVAEMEAKGRTTPYEKEYIRKDGSRFWGLFAASRIDDQETVEYVVDVTERRRTEEQLHESEERLQVLIENLPSAAAFIVDRDLRYILAEGEALLDVGTNSNDYVGKTIFEALDVEQATAYELRFRGALNGEPFVHEHTVDDHTFVTRGVPLRGTNDAIYAVLAVSYDITEHKRAEEALRVSEARFRTLTDAVPQVIWSNEAGGKANYFNQRWFTYSGKSLDESIGLGWQVIVHPDDAPASVELWNRALASGIIFDTEYRLCRADGEYRWHIGRNVPLRDAQGNVIDWFGSATDIHDLKEAEAALQHANEHLERRVDERTVALATTNTALQEEVVWRIGVEGQRMLLLQSIITAQEDERQRIARELHDSLGQFLTALNIRLSIVQTRDGVPEDVGEEIKQLRAFASQIDNEVDRLTMDLRPPSLESLGLLDAVRSYTAEWTATSGIPVEVLALGQAATRLPAVTESTVYRIVQEALTNVLKHAQATTVSVIIEWRALELRVIIEDNGVGFAANQTANTQVGGRQVGVIGMTERATLAGGELTIESEVGTGTTIYLTIPVSDHPPATTGDILP